MKTPFTLGIVLGHLLLIHLASNASRAQTGPPLLGPIQLQQDRGDEAAALVTGPPHESAEILSRSEAVDRVTQAPPPPIVENPRGDRPTSGSVWVDGYWTWDPDRSDYAWVPGDWREPPPGKIWLGGNWRRDEAGWYRVPGTWIDRPGAQLRPDPQPEPSPTRVATDWRTNGPPEPRDEPSIPTAPGPNFFWIPGAWAPEADNGVAWKPGFWSKVQLGWEWVPAYWLRRSDGWAFAGGRWNRLDAPNSLDVDTRSLVSTPIDDARDPVDRYAVARPRYDTNPALTDLQPIPDLDRPNLAMPNLAPDPLDRLPDDSTYGPDPYGERPGYGSAYGPYGPGPDRPNLEFDPIAAAESRLPRAPYPYPYPPGYRPYDARGYPTPRYRTPTPIIRNPRDAINFARSQIGNALRRAFP